ncbi:Uncharacterized protein DAT39_000860, partial [Clarias magur]
LLLQICAVPDHKAAKRELPGSGLAYNVRTSQFCFTVDLKYGSNRQQRQDRQNEVGS